MKNRLMEMQKLIAPKNYKLKGVCLSISQMAESKYSLFRENSFTNYKMKKEGRPTVY